MAFIHEGFHEEAFIDFLTHIFSARGPVQLAALLVSGTDVAIPLTIDGEPFPWSEGEDAGAERDDDGAGKEENAEDKKKEDDKDKKDTDHEHHFIEYDYDYWEGYALERCSICGEQRIVYSV